MKNIKLLNEKGIVSDEAIEALISKATNVSCQCPGHLIEIFRSIQAFTEYQKNCINTKPQDENIHNWLRETSVNLEHILSNTIITLARMEGMIDENDQIIEDS